MYPTPPYVQKPHQSKAENLQNKETQEADLEAIKRNKWAPSTLRNFFEKKLKVKVTDLP